MTDSIIQRAVVRTHNGSDVSWGPMGLTEAIAMACEMPGRSYRYVEVAGVTVFDYDDAERLAAHAIRDEARARGEVNLQEKMLHAAGWQFDLSTSEYCAPDGERFTEISEALDHQVKRTEREREEAKS
jgi:hypothetical protein